VARVAALGSSLVGGRRCAARRRAGSEEGRPHRAAAIRRRRPRQRQLDAHDLCSIVLAEGRELGEQASGTVQLEAETAAQTEVVLGGWCLSRRSRFAIHAWI